MIQVKQFFQGRETGERVIAPGEYAEKDPALFGLADYLVENGYAERISTPEQAEKPDQVEKPDGPPKRRGKFVGVPDEPSVEKPDQADKPEQAEKPDAAPQADAPRDQAEKPGDEFLDETNRPAVKDDAG